MVILLFICQRKLKYFPFYGRRSVVGIYEEGYVSYRFTINLFEL